MERPSWDEIFMNICEIISKRSTCAKLQTAAILVKNNNIISIGYNGSCSGAEHCDDYWYNNYWSDLTFPEKLVFGSFKMFLKSDEFSKMHHEWANLHELHGECNAIINAARNNISSEDSVMYSVFAPCTNCSKIIISSGISTVYYKHLYKRDTHGIEFLEKNNVECFGLLRNPKLLRD